MVYSDKGHLDYYKAFNISPVRYDVSNLRTHFDRRASLYRQLGLPEVAFRGSRVLEVASGSGSNSLYLSKIHPKSLELVEPNPTAIKDIRKTQETYGVGGTRPILHENILQNFTPEILYDVVICENWLGAKPDERTLIKKLTTFVAPGGALVLTIVPLSGFMPNILRKLMADRIVSPDMNFDAKTDLMLQAFSPHLSTIKDMTRSYTDWVHDCMINPHYLNVALPLNIVLKDIGKTMDALGSSPSFNTDWRWFKSLHGSARNFNKQFLENHICNTHNFIDYRYVYPPRLAAENQTLENECTALHQNSIELEKSLTQGLGWRHSNADELLKNLDRAAQELSVISKHFSDALKEAGDVLAADSLNAAMIANQKYFCSLFGRETVYVSFTRNPDNEASY